MVIDGAVLAELARILVIAVEGSYKDLDSFASALERFAATVRIAAARQRAEVNGDRLIG